MPLDEYVASGISIELNNGQTRLLSGEEKSYKFGRCSPNLLNRAKQNIREHFIVTGLVEEFERSLALMKITCGWSSIRYVKRNVAPNRPAMSSIPKRIIDSIKKYNQLDLELYSYARKRLQHQLEQSYIKIAREIARLRIANLAHAALSTLHRLRL